MDDDTDCAEHDWVLEEAHLTSKGTDRASACTRCGAVSYQPTQAARRPPLTDGGFAGT